MYEKYLKYHSGGIAGDKGTLRQNEMIAVLEEGEAVLDKKKQESAMNMIDFISALSRGLSVDSNGLDFMSVFNGLSDRTSNVASINPPSAVEINFGDVVINGADGDTVQQHIEVNRRFANEIFDILHIKK